jgi:hypothetical protein
MGLHVSVLSNTLQIGFVPDGRMMLGYGMMDRNREIDLAL